MKARVANSSSKMKLRVETQFAMWLMWITTSRKILFLELHGGFGYGHCGRLLAIESVCCQVGRIERKRQAGGRDKILYVIVLCE